MERGAGISELRAALEAGRTTPEQLVEGAYERLEALDSATVITFIPYETALARARALAGSDASRLPLLGVPFVVKDNIDVAGVATTAGCPAFATIPEQSATVVRRLEEAGAIAVAKTNLDQFATGLVGTRSPYGTPRNPFDPGRVPGGSSSGSAVAVANGAVPFALGTDTAGSGRVPAAFTGIVGAKPTRGWLSTTGVLPAVRTMDCVSVFALSVPDAWNVLQAAGGFDRADPFSRLTQLHPVRSEVRVGVGGGLRGDVVGVSGLVQAGALVEVDLAPFFEAGAMLYEGPWIAERLVSFGPFVNAHPDDVDPAVRAIVAGADRWSAADAAAATYRLAALRRRVDEVWGRVDVLVTPTVPMHPSLAEVAAEPLGVNALLGRYTNFANLLDLCAVAVPTGIVDGLPVGVSVVAPAWRDALAADVAARIHASTGGLRGATGAAVAPPWRPAVASTAVSLAVVGAHLRGQPLNHQLSDLGAVFVGTTRTLPCYRLYALAGTSPPKPGLVRVADGGGTAIEVEVYELTEGAFGRFVAAVPSPLCIGTVVLDTGPVAGFLVEPAGLDGALDISGYGGWRAYRAQGSPI